MITFTITVSGGVSLSPSNGGTVNFTIEPIAHSIPAGGTDGQVLTKTSATDYEVAWETPSGGGGGGGGANLSWTAATRTVASDSGTDAIITVADGTNAGLMTSADFTKLSGIEAAADVTDAANVGAVNAAATSKTTPVDADSFPIVDSEAANVIKRTTFTNFKAFLKTYFDTIYTTTSAVASQITTALSGYLTSATAASTYEPLKGTDDNFVTDAEKVKLGNLSGTNTGDQTTIVGITGTKAQFDTAVTDGDFMYIGDAPTAHTHPQSEVTNLVTDLSGKAPLASPTFTGTVTTPAIVVSSETASRIAILDASKNIKSADTTTYPSLTELAYVKGVTSAIQTQFTAKAPLASPTFTGTVTTPAIIVSSETASTIASFDASKNVKSLATATYPSLSELAYVKGVTSAIQTQLNGKQPLDAELTAIAGLTSAADKGIQFTGSGTAAVYDLTAAGKALLDDANAAAQLVTLGFTSTITELNYTDGVTSAIQTQLDARVFKNAVPCEFIVACSDETTALTTGTAKVTFRAPYAFTVTAVRASVTTAPTGGTLLTVDINESGVSILSTKLTFDASEKTTTTAATPAVISDSAIADDAEITIDIDAVGSTIAGAGLKVVIIGTHAV